MLRSRVRFSAPISGATLIDHDGDALDAVIQRAKAAAFAAGVAHGRQEELADAAGRVDAIAQVIEDTQSQATDSLARIATELATSIAQTLLRRETIAGNYDIETIVRETLAESAVGRNSCTVHLNPADYASLADVRFRSGTHIQSDDGIALGDVHVETSLGVLVREVGGCLESIKKGLLEEVR